jgi:agmatinase
MTDEPQDVIHQPWDALDRPRFTGPRTFARLPHVQDLTGVDVAVLGLPWDGSTTFRSGARFGPEAIRSASAMLRTYNPAQGVQAFGELSCVDYGDAPTAPGYVVESLDRIGAFLAPLAAAGVVTVGMGGDHLVTLPQLRALAAQHGPLGLVHLDAHADLWDAYNGLPYGHGTVLRRAIDEGVLEPARVVQAGMRGSLYSPDDERIAAAAGATAIPWEQLAQMAPAELAALVRERVGDGPTFLSLDVDFVDPAYCPGTGTPEVGGPTSHQALQFVRALSDMRFVGYDVVEVAPAYDSRGALTALFAATAMFEMVSLARRASTRLGAGG